MIHPTAVVNSGAQIGKGVEIGPYAVIDGNVVIGDNCQIGPHTYLTGHTTIGHGNKFHSGAVIGDAPQDLKYRDEPTQLVVGDGNVFREHVTVHRSAKIDQPTRIGSHCLLMAGSHVAHNCELGDHVIMANGAMLGGHVTINDRVFISGSCLVHQFVRIGTLALMQGGAAISLDLPPFCVVSGANRLSGLNTIGLRRAGLTSEQRLELRRIYHALFRRQGMLQAALAELDPEVLGEPAKLLVEFVRTSKRGICSPNRARMSKDSNSD
ncbi:acyl-ACP--UDP-N-acetylglucosamine O-acyltransferase [bacterium]|nr:acyl-ACP--UDP-N-acetylglucosamine O-acyltransferase [bacterium]